MSCAAACAVLQRTLSARLAVCVSGFCAPCLSWGRERARRASAVLLEVAIEWLRVLYASCAVVRTRGLRRSACSVVARQNARLTRARQSLSAFLSKQDQDFPAAKVQASAKALAHRKLLAHKDESVRMLVARCLSEIVRICAPDAPYDDITRKAVFDLFAEQLKGVTRVNGPSYGAVIDLLQSLAAVKAFILLAFLDMYVLHSRARAFACAH